MKKQNKKLDLISFLLRSGLAIVFFYAAISSFLQPTNWIGFVPNFIELIVSKEIFLVVFSIFELTLGLLLLANYKIFPVSVLSTLTIFAIILGNQGVLEIIFRDFAILFMSLALNVLSHKNGN